MLRGFLGTISLFGHAIYLASPHLGPAGKYLCDATMDLKVHNANTAVDVLPLKREMGKIYPEYWNFEQQDAEEFMLKTIDVIHEELKENLQWLVKQSNLVLVPQETRIRKTLKCTTCFNERLSEETLTCLQLGIDNQHAMRPSLQPCLAAYFAQETYHCACVKPGCNGTEVKKTLEVVHCPKYLMVIIKLFCVTQNAGDKLDTMTPDFTRVARLPLTSLYLRDST